ncbi:hypothetical protein GCM10025868_19920 [Angustibacter aerolatus]|uniref:Glycosyl hydrolase family 4 C-terminal domain-containing protein n=1 Tax=Angustibacter aerolatus TaxID=1162965 RepID=A0ABQ6JEW0_9ACTN|nr:hypothetical protein GCM10025868_19920 [Angustibacter aerolatus]
MTTHLDRREAMQGADFVINSIQVGMHEATVRDFEIPARYGLRQTIGDTLGVGGVFRALRTFPVLDGIASDLLDVCPDAWLLNYTNPMAMNVGYLRRRYPAVKVVGLCHSVYWTVHDLCEIVGVPLDEVEYASAGVNHQAWLLRWERDGESLYPLLDKAIEADPEALAAGAVRHVPPPRPVPDRDQRALVGVRALVPAQRRRDRAAAHPGGGVRADQRAEPRDVRPHP